MTLNCRTCFDTFSLNEMKALSTETDLLNALNYLLKSQVETTQQTNLNKLPNYICSQCTKRLTEAVTFLRQCVNVHQSYLASVNELKVTRSSLPQPIVSCTIDKDTQDNQSHSYDDNYADDSRGSFESHSKDDNQVTQQEDKPELDHSKFICNFCNRSFMTKFRLKNHLRTHSNDRPFICSVPTCNMAFRQANALRCHRRIHTGSKPYVCEVCNQRFRQKATLKTHMTVHTGKTVHCEQCDKAFSRSSYLIAHMRVAHSGIRAYACHICPSRFKQKSHLDQHLSVHSGIRFPCHVCGKEYSKKWSLKVHMYSHESEDKLPHCCEICGMTFILRNKLHAHTRLKHKTIAGDAVDIKIIEDAPAPSNVVEVETRQMMPIEQQSMKIHKIIILAPRNN